MCHRLDLFVQGETAGLLELKKKVANGKLRPCVTDDPGGVIIVTLIYW